MTRIPLHDVLGRNRSVQAQLDHAWQKVVRSGIFINGPELKQFEYDFARYIGVQHCVGVGNATDGFEIAFQALGLNADDEVIIPANAHVSPALAALRVGSKPVFCDVDEHRMLLNAETVSAQLSARTKVVVAVHLYGHVCPMDELLQLCRVHGLLLVEDFSQAHGAMFKQQRVGSCADISVCSFYPTKPLGCLGDGGAVLTSNTEWADRCRILANYGWVHRDDASLPGRNSRLDELQAAMLNTKLQYLDQWNAMRMEMAQIQQHTIGLMRDVAVPTFRSGDVCHLFVIRSDHRDGLKSFLTDRGVECRVHYPVPIHQQRLFNARVRLPVAETSSQQVLSVPVNERVVELLLAYST